MRTICSGCEYVSHDLARYLTPRSQENTSIGYTLREPKSTMPLYHLIGAWTPSPIAIFRNASTTVAETLAEWIPYNGLTHMKIKLAGDDLQWISNACWGWGSPRSSRCSVGSRLRGLALFGRLQRKMREPSITCSTFWES